MNHKNLIVAALFSIAMISCKKDGEVKTGETPVAAVEQKPTFKVELDVIAEKDDNFAVYFTEDNTTNFPADNAVWGGVKGGQSLSQKVIFNFPEDVFPTDIRFDFGIKKGAEQGDIILERFKMLYAGKEFEAKGSEFFAYFAANKDVKTEIDEAKGTIKFLKNSSGNTTPLFYPMPLLKEQIVKLTQQ